MRATFDYKFGIVENKKYINLVSEDGDVKLNGATVITYIVKHLMQWNINLTFINEKELGVFANGSYSGLYGKLQRQEIDFLFPFGPMNVDNDLFTFSPAVTESKHVILSMNQPSKRKFLELLWSLYALDWRLYLCVFFSSLLYYVFIKRFTIRIPSNYFIGIFFHQNFHEFTNNRLQIITLIIVMCHTFFYDIITANFSTDLSVSVMPPSIETLKDIIERDVRPCFYDFTGTHRYFQFGVTEERRDVWKIALRKGLDRSLYTVENMHTSMRNINDFYKGTAVTIGPDLIRATSVATFCAFLKTDADSYLERNQVPYMSNPLVSTVVAYPLRHGLEYTKLVRFQDIMYSMIEQGFMERYTFLMGQGSVTELTGEIDAACEAKVYLHRKGLTTSAYEEVQLFHYKKVIFFFVIIMTVGTSIFGIESLFDVLFSKYGSRLQRKAYFLKCNVFLAANYRFVFNYCQRQVSLCKNYFKRK